jgi:hypothetical protein
MNSDASMAVAISLIGITFCTWAFSTSWMEGRFIIRRKGDVVFKVIHYTVLSILALGWVFFLVSFITNMGAA